MFKKMLFTLSLITCVGTTYADEVAGRVNKIDREAKTIVVHPYMNRTKTPADVKLQMQLYTKYEWHPVPTHATVPTFDQVKTGSWVRVTYDSKKNASKVVIHVKN